MFKASLKGETATSTVQDNRVHRIEIFSTATAHIANSPPDVNIFKSGPRPVKTTIAFALVRQRLIRHSNPWDTGRGPELS